MEATAALVATPSFSKAQVTLLPDPAFAVDRDGAIVAWNKAATKLFGWRAESAIGNSCAGLLEGRSIAGRECRSACPRASGLGCIDGRCSPHPSLRVTTIDGSTLDVTVVEFPIMLERVPALLHLLKPVSGFQRDPLTGLVGRNEVTSAFRTAQSSAERSEQALSIALIDLDHLKRINDHDGHAGP